MRATAIRHVPFEDLGSFEAVLRDRGFDVRYVDAAIDTIPDGDTDLLIVLGGPIGAYEEDAYPFLTGEIRLVAERIASEQPTLGICLGCQIMARALGARVFGAGAKEIGWSPLSLSEDGMRSPLVHLAPDRTEVLHWHGDTFDLPTGATLLASTPACRNQAFAAGAKVLGMQFHAEVTAAGLEQWFVGHACEIAATPGIDVSSLRTEAARKAAVLERQGRRFLESWLDSAFSR